MEGLVVKKFVVAAVAAIGFVGTASAADMPTKAPMVRAPIAEPFSWTGLYVGGNFGYMWSKTTGNFAPFNSDFPWDAPYNSALGGVQAGFNWQFNQFVIGVEGSWDGTFNSSFGSTSGNGLAGPCGFPVFTSCEAKISNIASVGGRLGWTPWSQWLLSAQGGWASAHISTDGIINATGVTFSPTSARHNGWFVGGSIDYAVTPIVSVGIDYKHYDFNSAAHIDENGVVGNNRSIKATADAVFAHVNFKLWGPGGLIH